MSGLVRHTLSILSSSFLFLLTASLASASAAQPSEEDPLTLVTAHCESEGGHAQACTCVADTFGADVLDAAPNAEVGLLAAQIHVGDTEAMMRAHDTAGTDTIVEASQLLMAATPALEACMEIAEEVSAAQADLPRGDSPRARFIRSCAGGSDPDVCRCIADELETSLSPQEIGLIVDMRRAESGGEDAIAALAEDRGMSEEEVRQAIAQSTGRIAAAMMAIDPMSCVSY